MNENKLHYRFAPRRRTNAFAHVVTRVEAQRHFNLSLAVVIVITIGILAAVASMPMASWEEGYGVSRSSEQKPGQTL